MWNFDQPYFEGKLIAPDQAWRTLEDWRARAQEIGVWYVSRSGWVRALGSLAAARNGHIELRGTAARATFNLIDARFTLGPIQMFPRWPMGPMIEANALQAFLPTDDWLVLAPGMRPDSLPPRALPA